MGGNLPPFREPCPGSDPGTGCRRAARNAGAAHASPGDEGIPKYLPTVTVANPASGPAIPPYETTIANSTDPCPIITEGTPHGGWIGSADYAGTLVEGYAPNGTWVGTLPNPGWHHTDGDNVNFAVCHKRGFKNVAGCFQWNGSYGFNNQDSIATIQCDPGPCMGWPTGSSWVNGSIYGSCPDSFEPPRLSPPSQTKYLSLSIACEYIYTNATYPARNYDVTDSRDMSIDENSGELTSTGTDIGTIPAFAGAPDILLGKCLAGLAAGLPFVGFMAPPLGWLTGGLLDLSLFTIYVYGSGTDNCGGSLTRNSDSKVFEKWSADFGGGHFKREYYNAPGSDLSSYVEELTITETQFIYSLNTVSDNDSGVDQVRTNTCTATLSNAWTSAQVYADMATQLQAWMLNDDKLYPWRTDGLLQVAPLVSRNQRPLDVAFAGIQDLLMTDENGVTPGGTGYIITLWKDQNIWVWQPPTGSGRQLVQIFDGQVLGSPQPAGYEDFFCWQFQDWQGGVLDNGSDPIVFDWCQYGYGMTVAGYILQTGAQLPLNCTQWTDNFEVINKPPSAYLGYNDQTPAHGPVGDPTPSHNGSYQSPAQARRSSALWGYKYAEILDTWPSQKFARPGGADKFLIDETKVYSVTGTALTRPDGTAQSTLDITSGLWGGPCVGGWYSGCSYAGGVVTLGTKVFNVPAGWQSKSYIPPGLLAAIDDTAEVFGQLRFPTCPSLLGRIGITMAGTVATFASAQLTFGMAVAGTEQVDILGVDNVDGGGHFASLNVLASNVTATRITTAWASATYTLGQLIVDSNKNVQQVTTAGTSGGSAPSWNATVGGSTTDGGVTWKNLGSHDLVFSLPANYAGALWVMIHGAPNFYFNDNTSKGHYAELEVLFDNRTNGEVNRLSTVTDCDGTTTPPSGSPSANNGYATFSQTQDCLPLTACAPRVVCITPNGEMFPNGRTFPFPSTFTFDPRYGSKWQGWVQATMSDLFYQAPHAPCLGYPVQWIADDGTCKQPVPGALVDWSIIYYPVNVPVETELTVPSTYGPAQNEASPTFSPTLPSGIVIGWLSPVSNTGADVAYPPGSSSFTPGGLPVPFATASQLHYDFCNLPSGCLFAAQYAAGANGC